MYIDHPGHFPMQLYQVSFEHKKKKKKKKQTLILNEMAKIISFSPLLHLIPLDGNEDEKKNVKREKTKESKRRIRLSLFT